MRAPEGTLISFATQPGNVAQDGVDGNSPFTKALAQTIKRPGLGIFDAINEVGLAVRGPKCKLDSRHCMKRSSRRWMP
jgi:uncharacterized caspase-like protein